MRQLWPIEGRNLLERATRHVSEERRARSPFKSSRFQWAARKRLHSSLRICATMRMRALYAHRQQTLVAALAHDPIPAMQVEPAPAGLLLLGRLPRKARDRQISHALAKAGIDARALSEFAIERKLPPALILGYTGVGDRAIRDGVRTMRRVLSSVT